MLRLDGRVEELDLVRKQTTRYGAAERGYYSFPPSGKNGLGAPSVRLLSSTLNEGSGLRSAARAHLLCRNFRFRAFVTALGKGTFALARLSLDFER